MTRSSRPSQIAPALLAVVLTALVALTGCTATVGGSPAADPAPAPTEGPGSDPVAWVDRVCGAALSFAIPATAAPDFAGMTDLPAVQRTFSDYLGTVVTGVQQGRTQLDAVGRSPVPGGDEAVGRAESALQFLEQDFAGAKTAVDTADPNNPDTFLAALTQVEATLGAITPPDPLGDVSSTPRLQRAAERAAQCQQLSTLAPAAPR
jgi:hypothetical protein